MLQRSRTLHTLYHIFSDTPNCFVDILLQFRHNHESRVILSQLPHQSHNSSLWPVVVRPQTLHIQHKDNTRCSELLDTLFQLVDYSHFSTRQHHQHISLHPLSGSKQHSGPHWTSSTSARRSLNRCVCSTGVLPRTISLYSSAKHKELLPQPQHHCMPAYHFCHRHECMCWGLSPPRHHWQPYRHIHL